jgi:hypothetical protein
MGRIEGKEEGKLRSLESKYGNCMAIQENFFQMRVQK